MKRIKALFIVWIAVFGLIYVLNGSKAAAAMVIIAAVYGVLAFIITRIAGKRISAEITGGSSCNKGESVGIKVSEKNESGIPVPVADIGLSSRNLVTDETVSSPVTTTFPPKGSRTDEIKVSDRLCGKEEISIEEIKVSDPVRLFSRKRKMSGKASVYVMPEIKEIDIPSSYLDSYDMESYTYSQHKKGQDPGEVFGIRDYQDGDSPKQIHWKLSAKMDDLMVKIPSYPIENKLVVLLDNSISEKDDLTPERRSGLIEFFFSLSFSLLKRNIAHSLGWCDHESGRFIIHKVEREEDMWQAVPEALGAGIRVSKLTTAYRFLAEMGEEHYTNHFIVTATEARETERLSEFGEVRVFRTGEEN